MDNILDEAIALKIYDYGEADGIVVLVTRRHGKVRALARGFRKPRFRAVSPFVPFCVLEVKLRPAAGDRLWTLVGADVRSGRGLECESLGAFHLRSYMGEVLLSIEMDSGAGEKFFRLFNAVSSALAEGSPPGVLLVYFQVWLLRLEGILPDPAVCGRCGKGFSPERPPFSFVSRQGTFRCGACRFPGLEESDAVGEAPYSEDDAGSGRESFRGDTSPEETLNLFRLIGNILHHPPAGACAVQPSAYALVSAAEGLNGLIVGCLSKSVKSFSFLIQNLG